MSNKYLIVIGGPTASGKTSLSIQLANALDAEIFSADSRQFFREMNVGTAKPTTEELSQANHHFVNHLSIFDSYSVGDFEKDVIVALTDYFAEKNIAILVGGSGLYIQAVCEGLDNFPDVSNKIRQAVQNDYKTNGLESLQQELETKDPVYWSIVDLQNPKRLIRAIEVIRASGKPFSDFQNKKKAARNFTPIYISLEPNRALLYDKINHRVDVMVQNGLIYEARNLFPYKNLNALQTVGYREFFDIFMQKSTIEEAIELVKRNTRRYAKRQLTWLRRADHWNRFGWGNEVEIIDFCKKKIEK